MKILITGGAGFIGSHLAERMLKEGNEVYVVDNLSTGSMDNIKHIANNNKFYFKEGSVLNPAIIENIIQEVDVVFHLAAAVGVSLIMEKTLESINTNVAGTEIVVKLASKYNKKVILASSSEIYGKNEGVPLKETDNMILGPPSITRWNYSCAKALDEFLALAYYKEKKLPVVIVRFFNVVGPKQTGMYGMVVPRFIKQALSNQNITIYGDGKQSRCFSYVGDVVDALLLLLNNPKAVGNIYNVGSDEEVTIEELAKKIIALTKSSSKLTYIPYEKVYKEGFEDTRRRVPGLDKIKGMAFKPKCNLEDTLMKIIEHFKNED